jgi:hypothetical protein
MVVQTEQVATLNDLQIFIDNELIQREAEATENPSRIHEIRKHVSFGLDRGPTVLSIGCRIRSSVGSMTYE